MDRPPDTGGPPPGGPPPGTIGTLERKAAAALALDRFLRRIVPWLPPISFCVLAYSAASALVSSEGDSGTLVFVVGSVSLVAALHFSASHYDRNAPADSPKNALLKVAFWVVSAALTVLFTHRVTTIVDSPALHLFVWTVAALTISFGFALLFLF